MDITAILVTLMVCATAVGIFVGPSYMKAWEKDSTSRKASGEEYRKHVASVLSSVIILMRREEYAYAKHILMKEFPEQFPAEEVEKNKEFTL